MIGEGSYGKVYLVRKTGDAKASDFSRLYALKVVNMKNKDI